MTSTRTGAWIFGWRKFCGSSGNAPYRVTADGTSSSVIDIWRN
jgi:hypothetical protein